MLRREGMQSGVAHSTNATTAVVREKSWVALLLAWVAAFSDAIGFLVLQQLGASFMSGNSMAMGAALGRLDWSQVLQRGLPILAFFLGNMLGYLILMLARRRGMRSPFAIIFGLEAVLLLMFLLLGSQALRGGVIPSFPPGIFVMCIVLLTVAMGLQTSTIRWAGTMGVRTTFVTGVLSDWAQTLTQYVTWLSLHSTQWHRRVIMRESFKQASFRHLLLLVGIWVAYVLGAVCGSALEQYMALLALLFPVCVLVGMIVLDLFRPMEWPEDRISRG